MCVGMATKAQWEALEAAILANLTANVRVASYTINGQTVTYHGLDAQRKLLDWVQSKIQEADTTGAGNWALARF